MVRVIIDEYQPERIILFGPMVDGVVHELCDISLIIIKDSEKSFFERIEDVKHLVKPKEEIDISVYTLEEFENMEDKFPIQEKVTGVGRVIYSTG